MFFKVYLPEEFFFLRWPPVVVSASSLTCPGDLHFILQKKDRRAPGHNLVAPCGTSVLTGSIAKVKKIGIINS